MSRPIDVRELAAMLAQNVDSLVAYIFPKGKRHGHEYTVGSLSGEAGASLSINLGARAGVWSDFASGDGGDALDLVRHALCGGDMKEAIRWARRWLAIDDADPEELERRRVRSAAAREAHQQAQREIEEKTRASAFRLWRNSSEVTIGCPVDRYLEGRGISLAKLPRIPSVLRYHPQLFHSNGGKYPAMLAAITGADGKICAVHRTWLTVHADGSVTKAPLPKAKKVLGSYAGGCIRLWRGPTDRPIADASADEWVVVVEGIEDGLTIALTAKSPRVLVAVSLSNMQRVVLPAAVRNVIVCADNDAGNDQALAGLNRAIEHFLKSGRKVKLARPPAGTKDVNELLQKGTPDGERPRDERKQTTQGGDRGDRGLLREGRRSV